MFLVFNKEKIYTYIISMLTVMVLLFTASSINSINEETVDASITEEKEFTTYQNNIIDKNETEKIAK